MIFSAGGKKKIYTFSSVYFLIRSRKLSRRGKREEKKKK
jgi:hypothetical protein